MNGDSVRSELLNIFGHMQKVGDIAATRITQGRYFIDVYT
jgi:hypothetical protein